MAEHAWCLDIPRDEAVRAAEDGRSGPLPTLEEAIAAVTERRPPEPGGGGNVTGGLRTERVTLEITHDLDAPLGDWIVQVIDESLGYDESVRVVEEAKLAPAANADGGSNHAAPAASGAAGTGWLTAEEREAVQWLAEFAAKQFGLPWPCGIGASFPVVAHRLLARSSPPEVVVPASYAVEHPQPPRDLEWRKALASAGVTVKEVSRG